MRRLPTSLYLAAFDLPTDQYEAQQALAKRLPNMIFFAPMEVLTEMVAPYRAAANLCGAQKKPLSR
jgi:hypothetical protein